MSGALVFQNHMSDLFPKSFGRKYEAVGKMHTLNFLWPVFMANGFLLVFLNFFRKFLHQ